MCGPNSIENIKELLDPIHMFFNGIICVLHDGYNSQEHKYLESIKGEGKIIHVNYCKRHDFSRNHYLFCGPTKNGDWICQTDDLERLVPSFAQSISTYISQLKTMSVNAAYYYGKPLLYEFHESLQFFGSPHEGLNRQDGKMQAIELSKIFTDESKVRINVRPLKRTDPYGWVDHYMKYYLFPWGSNQCLLGNENRGNPMEIFLKREELRLQFVEELENRGFERSLDGVKILLKSELDNKLKNFLNKEKIIQDFYRYHILMDLTVKDEHKWTDLKQF